MKIIALRALGLFLLALALTAAQSQAPARPVETLVARWGGPPSQFIDVRGQLAHVRDTGPRDATLPPIVLLHGTASSLHTWAGWTAVLQRQRRVIAVDLPGFGLTGPAVGDDYHPDTTAHFVIALLQALQVPRAVVVGHSTGGEIAWRVAALAPERIAGLVLIDASGATPPPAWWPLARVVAGLPGVDSWAETVLPRALVEAVLRHQVAEPDRIDAEQVDRHFELLLREGNRRALLHRLRQWPVEPETARLAALRVPTLIVWGRLDPLIAPGAAQRYAELIPNSRVVLLDGLGHLPQEEDAARSVAPLLVFSPS